MGGFLQFMRRRWAGLLNNLTHAHLHTLLLPSTLPVFHQFHISATYLYLCMRTLCMS